MPSNFMMAQKDNNSVKAQRRYRIVKFFPIPFIIGLVVSYKYIELSVQSIIMDYLTNSTGLKNQRIAVIVRNLQDGLSSLVSVFVSQILESRTGSFIMITFCAAATTQGLMLLWTSALSNSAFYAVYPGLFILAIGMAGQKLSENFLENHLEEKIKGRKESQHGSTQNKREEKPYHWTTILINFLMFATSGGGYAMTYFLSSEKEELFKFAALIMGGTSLLFFIGYVWYSHEKLSVESSICKICRIFVAAFRRRGLRYPTDEVHYYCKDYEQQHFYKNDKEIRLLPRVPRLFRWLDKAAIVNEEDGDLEKQEKKGKLCTVEEVRAVKSFVPMIYVGFTIFPYGLLIASEGTFFVAQASIATSQFTTDDNDIPILYLFNAGAYDVARFAYFVASFFFLRLNHPFFRSLRKYGTTIRIGLGIACAAACSFMAWRAEADRLSSNESTTLDLIPQFVLLGAAEGLFDGALAKLFHDKVSESLWSFQDSFSTLVFGSGKLLIIPIVFICGFCIKNTVDSSRLDIYYMILATLNALLFPLFAYYSIRYARQPEDATFMTMENLEHDHHQPESQDTPEIDTEAITSCCECDGCIYSSIHLFFPHIGR